MQSMYSFPPSLSALPCSHLDPPNLSLSSSKINSAVCVKDRGEVWTCADDTMICVWDARTMELLHTLADYKDRVGHHRLLFVFQPDFIFFHCKWSHLLSLLSHLMFRFGSPSCLALCTSPDRGREESIGRRLLYGDDCLRCKLKGSHSKTEKVKNSMRKDNT